MVKQRFRAELQEGHKGAAVLVPFDPAREWGSEPVPAPIPGRLGHAVRGTIGGVSFEGFIGKRWGRCFILVDAELQRRAGCAVGDQIDVEVAPAPARTAARPRRRGKRT